MTSYWRHINMMFMGYVMSADVMWIWRHIGIIWWYDHCIILICALDTRQFSTNHAPYRRIWKLRPCVRTQNQCATFLLQVEISQWTSFNLILHWMGDRCFSSFSHHSFTHSTCHYRYSTACFIHVHVKIECKILSIYYCYITPERTFSIDIETRKDVNW